MLLFPLVASLASCGGKNTPATVSPPGGEKSGHLRTLEAGGKLMQDKTPLAQIDQYLDAFHWYAGDMGRQVEAHHYCTHANEDFAQCVIYDSNGANARLIGVEYIVSEKLFQQLPDEEKRLWHSHQYEARSGQVIAPGVPEAAEKGVMAHLEKTYGKVWHFWQVDRGDTLPLGIPQLMMGFTADGQIKEELLADRDHRFNISTQKKRQGFQDIPERPTLPGANSWQHGDVIQLDLRQLPAVQNLRGTTQPAASSGGGMK